MAPRGRRDRTALPTLTALRGLAALAVFGSHVEPITTRAHLGALRPLLFQGFTGVSFFFILSGFVLAWSHRAGDTAPAFWRRRFARIYPAHLTALLLTVLLILWISAFAPASRGARMIDLHPTAGDFARVTLLLQSWLPARYFALNGPTWSLSCELFFYALGPLLIPRLLGLAQPSRRLLLGLLGLGVVTAGALAALATAATHRFDGSIQLWLVYIFPPTRLMEFAIGVLLAAELRAGARPPIAFGPAAGLAALAYLVAYWVPRGLDISALTVIPFALLVLAAGAADLTGRAPLRHPALQLGGRASYAFYLVHALVIVAVAAIVVPTSGSTALVWSAGTLLAAMLLAYALYAVIEEPLEWRLRGGGRRVEEAAPAAGVATA
jgi:peptidoglycan/LPS O-acetylase OafA/YrhL